MASNIEELAGFDPAPLLERERRRVRFWAVATLVAWALLAAGVVAACLVYFTYLHPALAVDLLQEPRTEAGRERLLLAFRLLHAGGWAAALVWSALLLLAAACTVRFVHVSRSATLQQIQAGLAEISQQLRALATDMGEGEPRE